MQLKYAIERYSDQTGMSENEIVKREVLEFLISTGIEIRMPTEEEQKEREERKKKYWRNRKKKTEEKR
ncbi:hypothetical protein [Thermoflavimicrobium daqui]|uniref:Uncharacterized protein n=1 Tax=Thermoflavimicrobium daqui TaxID=2137476 RepID=A0A364K1L4_9BACL|nr:hypothetical protein [Thermoflavimicrobium daqui]RAL21919.1 hypothetical protein DL897_15115 [Thermoflavimicrobium daqui]